MSKQPDRNARRTKLRAEPLKVPKYEEIAALLENDCSIVPGGGTTDIAGPDREYDVEAINKEFAVVLTGSRGMILKISATGPIHDRVRIMRPDAFRLWFQNRFTQVVGSNGEPRWKTWAAAWLADKYRREYAGIEFFPNPDGAPGTPEYFNLWQGFDVEPSPTGSYAIFKDHLQTNVCGGDAGLFEYLFAWFAHIIQRPRERIGTAIVLRGKKGAGKTKIGEVIGSLFPAHYLLVDGPRYITGQFNVHMAKCLLLQADEAIWAGDKHAEGRLKGLITSETQMIEAKGLDSIQLKNYVRVLMTSEEDWVVPAGKDERRFLVLDVAANVAQNHEYFAEMDKELANGGRERLLYDLRNIDLCRISLRQVPRTTALLEQKLHSLDSVETWWYSALETGIPIRGLEIWPDQVSSIELYEDYHRAANEMGIARKPSHATFGGKMMKLVPGLRKTRPTAYTPEGIKRVWSYVLPSLDECRSSFEQIIGQTIDWPAITEHERTGENASFADASV